MTNLPSAGSLKRPVPASGMPCGRAGSGAGRRPTGGAGSARSTVMPYFGAGFVGRAAGEDGAAGLPGADTGADVGADVGAGAGAGRTVACCVGCRGYVT